MIIRNDIFSHAKRGHIYAKAGQQVELIRDCGNVLLVRLTGEISGFPIGKEDILNVKDHIIDNIQPVRKVEKEVKGSYKKQDPIVSQTSLF